MIVNFFSRETRKKVEEYFKGPRERQIKDLEKRQEQILSRMKDLVNLVEQHDAERWGHFFKVNSWGFCVSK